MGGEGWVVPPNVLVRVCNTVFNEDVSAVEIVPTPPELAPETPKHKNLYKDHFLKTIMFFIHKNYLNLV